ncbi:CoA binding domain-containing protein [Coniella lustricola]|uniref:CoA binding domain-containing protein n=1 Tax=Coniella lustricola TaxID=2025994 RepID=A0A2T2ZTW4_9PEZI|nr:CoA binding domain-containing protein [Coniella lustricola]
MSTEASLKTFFSSKYFAVVGASSNTAKFGHKIFAWYIHHSIPAIPINPTASHITVPSSSSSSSSSSSQQIPTIPSLSALANPRETSVSIITPPPVTLRVLQEAKQLGIPAVFLQPGTFDDEVLAYARRGEGDLVESEVDGLGFKSVVAGFGGGTRGGEGWCVLVDGERGLSEVGKL